MSEGPLRRGLQTARTVAPAGAVLVTVAVTILVSYHTLPGVQAALDAIAAVKLRSGIVFALLVTAVFGGLLPVLAQQAMPATRRSRAWRTLPYFAVFWALRGAEVDLFYRLQAWVFGDNTSPATVLCKVLVDQLGYTPLWALPVTVLGVMLPDRGPRKLWREVGRGWYRREILPILVANWFVWVPSVAVIYCLPLPLQLPIQNLVLCLWSVLLLVMVRKPAAQARQPLD